MSVPQGPVWQKLRQRALDAVPPGSALRFAAPVTLRQWQTQGAYSVAATATKRIDVVAYSTEIGGVMLTEAEHFLDHAAEHQVVVFRQLRATEWTSAAWQIVTVYYWAYFALLALTRLMGDSIWFVDDALAKQFTTLAPPNSPAVGAGAFRLTCGSVLTSTEREVTLHRQKARSHDALWKLWSGLVDDVVKTSTPVVGSDEERLFSAIRRAAGALGADWPSALRNLVNYRPGLSYVAVRSPKAGRAFRDMPASPHPFTELLASFENSVAALDRRFPISSQPEAVVRVLGDYTLVLHTLSRALHSEIVDRSGTDKRWRRSRGVFLEKHGAATRDRTWPCE